MSPQAVRFNAHDQPDFFKVLRKRVNKHFSDNNISKYANFNMKLKTVFMLCLYLFPLSVLLLGNVSSFWPMMLLWFLMGLGMSGIGVSVMHDANHGSYSSNQLVNKALGYVLNLIGGYHSNWKIQHNVLHHSFTNIDGHDEDISKGIMRFCPSQQRRKVFRFQLFYAPFLYGILSIYWLVAKDFEQLVRYNKRGLLEGQGETFNKALASVFFNKTWYLVLTIVLPLILIELPAWQILIGFSTMHFLCGLTLACIFQSAHVIEATDFYKADENGCIENSWAIHQLRTTANFANNSTVFSWLIGGLNYQIEHHLFPNICHVHYRNISPIVKATAAEFGVPYYQYKTFYGALKSHFTLLNDLGTGAYDRRLEACVGENK